MKWHKKNAESNKAPTLISDDAKFEYVESYKALRTNICFATMRGKEKKIVVTSTLPYEGKSSVAINLAISLAQAGNKVLLIDADMRKPTIHRYMRLKKNPQTGLSTLLSGDVKVGDCLIKTEYGFDVIAGGPIPPNPAELIASDAMRDLLKVASEHYEYIICDAPPAGVVTDPVALSPLCDGVLCVVRQRYANRNQIRTVIKRLQAVNAKILGVVLNQYSDSDRRSKKYAYYRGYRYGYGYGYGYCYGRSYGYRKGENPDSE